MSFFTRARSRALATWGRCARVYLARVILYVRAAPEIARTLRRFF